MNRNLKLETTTGEYLLRYYSYSSPEDIQREVALLTKLATEGFPVAPPIARLDGTYLNQEPEGYSVLFQFVEGDIPRLNPITVAQIAQTVAKLNRLTVWSAVEKPYYCTTTYCQNLLDQFPAADFQYPDLFAFYREEYLTLEPRLQQPVPRGLIHGDVFPDNTIFQGNQLKAIVDFDEFGIGPLLTEIGTAVNGFCFIKEQFQEDLFTVFLKNYESIRPLEAPERKLLPFYLRWGAFVFVS
ncbi:MAG: phosphotransferase, partial [Fidelibacterota bacterium]